MATLAYDRVGADGEKVPGCGKEGSREWRRQLWARFPGLFTNLGSCSIRTTRGGNSWSVHAVERALDDGYKATSVRAGGDRPRVDRLLDLLTANGGRLAKVLGLQAIHDYAVGSDGSYGRNRSQKRMWGHGQDVWRFGGLGDGWFWIHWELTVAMAASVQRVRDAWAEFDRIVAGGIPDTVASVVPAAAGVLGITTYEARTPSRAQLPPETSWWDMRASVGDDVPPVVRRDDKAIQAIRLAMDTPHVRWAAPYHFPRAEYSDESQAACYVDTLRAAGLDLSVPGWVPMIDAEQQTYSVERMDRLVRLISERLTGRPGEVVPMVIYSGWWPVAGSTVAQKPLQLARIAYARDNGHLVMLPSWTSEETMRRNWPAVNPEVWQYAARKPASNGWTPDCLVRVFDPAALDRVCRITAPQQPSEEDDDMKVKHPIVRQTGKDTVWRYDGALRTRIPSELGIRQQASELGLLTDEEAWGDLIGVPDRRLNDDDVRAKVVTEVGSLDGYGHPYPADTPDV